MHSCSHLKLQKIICQILVLSLVVLSTLPAASVLNRKSGGGGGGGGRRTGNNGSIDVMNDTEYRNRRLSGSGRERRFSSDESRNSNRNNNGQCPSICLCKWKNGKQWVECRNRGQISIPQGIHSETQDLDLSGNNLQILSKEIFARHRLVNLQKLHLSYCNIGQIDGSAFRGLTNLVELDLSHNILTHVPTPTFANIPYLRHLSLRSNPLSQIESNAFEMVDQLVRLELSNCSIQHVASKAFNKLSQLQKLDLSENKLSFMSSELVHSIKSLQGIELNSNPWTCDCRLLSLKKWLVEDNVPYAIEPKCHRPSRLNGRTFGQLRVAHFACQPQIISSRSRYLQASVGQNVTLSCRVGSIPKVRVRWFHAHNRTEILSTNLRQQFTEHDHVARRKSEEKDKVGGETMAVDEFGFLKRNGSYYRVWQHRPKMLTSRIEQPQSGRMSDEFNYGGITMHERTVLHPETIHHYTVNEQMVSHLMITNVAVDHSSEYLCVVENEAGFAETNFTLQVGFEITEGGIASSLESSQIAGIAASFSLTILTILILMSLLLIRHGGRTPSSTNGPPNNAVAFEYSRWIRYITNLRGSGAVGGGLTNSSSSAGDHKSQDSSSSASSSSSNATSSSGGSCGDIGTGALTTNGVVNDINCGDSDKLIGNNNGTVIANKLHDHLDLMSSSYDSSVLYEDNMIDSALNKSSLSNSVSHLSSTPTLALQNAHNSSNIRLDMSAANTSSLIAPIATRWNPSNTLSPNHSSFQQIMSNNSELGNFTPHHMMMNQRGPCSFMSLNPLSINSSSNTSANFDGLRTNNTSSTMFTQPPHRRNGVLTNGHITLRSKQYRKGNAGIHGGSQGNNNFAYQFSASVHGGGAPSSMTSHHPTYDQQPPVSLYENQLSLGGSTGGTLPAKMRHLTSSTTGIPTRAFLLQRGGHNSHIPPYYSPQVERRNLTFGNSKNESSNSALAAYLAQQSNQQISTNNDVLIDELRNNISRHSMTLNRNLTHHPNPPNNRSRSGIIDSSFHLSGSYEPGQYYQHPSFKYLKNNGATLPSSTDLEITDGSNVQRENITNVTNNLFIPPSSAYVPCSNKSVFVSANGFSSLVDRLPTLHESAVSTPQMEDPNIPFVSLAVDKDKHEDHNMTDNVRTEGVFDTVESGCIVAEARPARSLSCFAPNVALPDRASDNVGVRIMADNILFRESPDEGIQDDCSTDV